MLASERCQVQVLWHGHHPDVLLMDRFRSCSRVSITHPCVFYSDNPGFRPDFGSQDDFHGTC